MPGALATRLFLSARWQSCANRRLAKKSESPSRTAPGHPERLTATKCFQLPPRADIRCGLSSDACLECRAACGPPVEELVISPRRDRLRYRAKVALAAHRAPRVRWRARSRFELAAGT